MSKPDAREIATGDLDKSLKNPRKPCSRLGKFAF